MTLSRTKRSPDGPWLVTHTTNRPLRGLTVARNGIEVTRPLRTLLDVAGDAVADEELGDLFAHLFNKLVSVEPVLRFVDRAGRGLPASGGCVRSSRM